jgi:N-acetylglucosaminyldiphosphoundecaprenol N-acetyl-beta-D-mannosaminyltransferase
MTGTSSLLSVSILGFPVHAVTLAGALHAVETFLHGNQPRQIVTANALMLTAALRTPELARVLREADLVVPDSAGVLFAGRWKNRPFPERVTGIELMDRLCARAAEKNWTIFLLGGGPGVAEQAARRLEQRHPGLRIAGTRDGYFGPEQDGDVTAGIRETRPDLLFVGLNAPRQEIWIRNYLSVLGCKAAMGVGGSLDVFAGRLRRAPAWMQNAGLEWLFRLLQEPSRVRRMAALPLFAVRVLFHERR